MNTKLKYGLGALGVAVVGYLAYFQVQVNKLMELTYRFQKFRFLNVGLQNVRFTTELVVTNPSNLTFTITGYNLNVQIQDKILATIKGDNLAFTVVANSSVPLPLDVQFNPNVLSQNLLSVFLDASVINTMQNSTIPIRVVGTMSVKFGFLGFKNVPVDYTYQP